MSFSYKLEAKVGNARAGVLKTPHGVVKTPVFMPVGTQGSVKGLTSEDLVELGAQIILANTYHLYLRPGDKLVRDWGGLHEMMKWSGPILTDSGGFQVSSLGHFRGDKKDSNLKATVIEEDGVVFYSHLDGSKHKLTPEKAVEIQENLGADIIMAFDEATPDKGKKYAREAMERTHRWLVRCKARWEELEGEKGSRGSTSSKGSRSSTSSKGSRSAGRSSQALFGIIQGGTYKDLRRESAQFVVGQDLPGVAVGGGSIGQDPKMTERDVSYIRDLLPDDKPIYFMGVGVNPNDVVEAVRSGADMFDCVAPTRLARTGSLYSGRLVGDEIGKAGFESEFKNGRLSIGNARFKNDKSVLSEDCDCFTCKTGYTRAYLRHLFVARELTYYRLASIHNLRTMVRIAEKLRKIVLKTPKV